MLRLWLLFLPILGLLTAVRVALNPWLGHALARGTARLTAWNLTLLGLEGRASGNIVNSAMHPIQVVDSCTGADAVSVFAAAVLAFPISWPRKAMGLAWGIPALLAINQLRLVTLCFVGHRFPELFEAAHLLVWQGLIIVFTIGLWLVVVMRAEQRR